MRPVWTGLLVIVVIILATVSVAMLSGRHGSSLENIVLQSEDMDDITGHEEGWAQNFFGITESEDGYQACLSNMVLENDVHMFVTIWVWDVRNGVGAAQKFHELVASNQNFDNITHLEIGDDCVFQGAFIPVDGPFTGAVLCFHQGRYCVQMVFSGELTTQDLCIGVAQAQASRL
jgi:hypothetical protein